MVTPRSYGAGPSRPLTTASIGRGRDRQTPRISPDFFPGVLTCQNPLGQRPAERRLRVRRPDRPPAEDERRVRHDAGGTPTQGPDRAVAGVLVGRRRREVRVAVAVDVEEADRAAEVVARLDGSGDALGVL